MSLKKGLPNKHVFFKEKLMKLFRLITIVCMLFFIQNLSLHATGILKKYPFIQSITSLAFHGDILWVGTGDKGVLMFNTVNESFRYFDSGDGLLDNSIRSVTVDKKGTVWVGSNYGINCYENDVWKSFTYAGNELIYAVNSLTTDSQSNLWAACTNYNISPWISKIFKFDGSTWTKAGEFSGQSIWQGITTSDGSLWCNQDHGNLMQYKNNEWISYQQSPASHSYCIDSQDNLWFISGRHLIKYDFQSFTDYSAPLDIDGRIVDLYSIAVTESGVWCATPKGLAFFDGIIWHGPSKEYYEGIYSLRLIADPNGKIWVDGYGGIYVVDGNNPDMTVSVKEYTPNSFLVIKNYPNPFNPSTTISFTLSKSDNAILAVYNITGQQIRTLFSGSLPVGKHSIFWDGKDDSGRFVSSGVYLSRLQSGEKVVVERMLLLK
jgi:ligand-binding sensor domain-containing protein